MTVAQEFLRLTRKPLMPRERRDLISDLYHRALARAPEDRAAFLIEACNGDEALREEMESLLEFEPASAHLLERPAADVAAGVQGATSMIDRRLGPYTIVAPLGAGGMGEVYHARDGKLGRDVAIKILPAHFTADSERRARFAREARTLATLNHPHIGAIYGLEEAEGVTALVLELVQGETLADRLERGPLPLAAAVAIARQIAEALEAAHEKGIVHRDLKPANIVLQGGQDRLSNDVQAKVLDFGLAKPMAPDVAAGPTQAPSDSFAGTADGRILGTPAYMSPEQARGLTVDKRSDIWAFGCVLFEMLSGRRAFDAATITDTLARILDHEPDWNALPADTPAPIRTLLGRCLRKDPKRRLHDIADALIELEDTSLATRSSADTGAGSARLVAQHRGHQRLAWIIAAASLAIASGAIALRLGETPALVSPVEFDIAPPENWYQGARWDRVSPTFEISPDSQHITALALTQGVPSLWIREIARPPWRPLPGTDGATGPFWSPDSQSIGFFAGGQLKSIRHRGGAPIILSDAPVGPGPSGAWSPSGFIVFGGSNRLWRVRESGGNIAPVTTLLKGQAGHRWPSFLDNEHFLYLAHADIDYELRVGSLTAGDIASLGPFESNGVYAAGHVLFVRRGRLMARPFDATSRRWTGDPVVVAGETALAGYLQRGQFSVSSAGVLAYCRVSTGLVSSQLTWMDRKGMAVSTVGEPGFFFNMNLSRDERYVAVSQHKEQTDRPGSPFNIDIRLIDLARDGTTDRLTDHPAREFDPAWSHDGVWIAFNSSRDDGATFNLFRRRSDRGGEDEPLVRSDGTVLAPDWSRDGRHLLYTKLSATTQRGLWTLSLTGDRHQSAFLDTKYNETSGVFSPDGRWIAYVSDESGRNQVYVRPFPLREGLSPISRDGGWAPRWRDDGTELFFLAPDGAMMAAGIKVINRQVEATVPQRLFRTGLGSTTDEFPYTVSHDGQRFLIPVPADPPGAAPISVVMDWTERLPRRRPGQ